MEAFAPFLTVLSVVIPICVCSVLVARIYRKNAALDPKITTKLRKQQDEYIAELEHKVRQKQNKLNSMEKATSILAESDDLQSAIPAVLGEIGNHLPKWAQRIVKSNPELVNQVIDLAKKNPDKTRELIGRFIKNPASASKTDEDNMPGL